MAITKIKVNTNKLQKTATDMENALKHINKKSNQMQSDVKALNGMWEGDANQAFNQTFQDDITALQQVCDNIQKVINYENTAKKEYNSCEQKVAELVDKITV